MKILYALQATGNGHICRAQKIIPALRNYAEVDILTSGTESDINLGFNVKYTYSGFSFVFGKKGGIQWFRSMFRNNFFRLFREIKKAPVSNYDLIINDFEPVTAWACKRQNIPCIAMSHQYALLFDVPKPVFVPAIANWILHNYAPVKSGVGFHFKKYEAHIFYPIIRQAIRNQKTETQNKYTVYLPALSDRFISSVLQQIPQTQWEVFSKHCKQAYSIKNVLVQPPSATAFQQSMASATGVLCGAGFETPAEALFLKKKLMVIPMRDQYEQHYNAASLKDLGVPVLPYFSKKYTTQISAWVDQSEVPNIDFPDHTIPAIEYALKRVPKPS